MKLKIYKFISVFLVLAVILSTVLCAIGTVGAEAVAYYISPSGNDSNTGTSLGVPLKTLDKAIELANAKGLGVGDTVNVFVVNVDGQKVIWKGNGEAKAELTSHSFKLNISSYDTKATLGTGYGISLGGDTKIENITISSGNWQAINLKGYNVEIGKNVSFSGLFDFLVCSNWKTFEGSVNLYFKSNVGRQIVVGGNHVGPTFKSDVNITVDNSGANTFKLSAHQSNTTSEATNFKKNVNFDIKNASSLNIISSEKYTFAPESAIQIINSAEADLGSAITNASALKNTDGGNVGCYIINNKTGDKNLIEFTETTGLFKTNYNENAYSLAVDGEIADTDNGYLALKEGEHTVELVDKPKTVYMYISEQGDDSDSGMTDDEPLRTVVGAINAAVSQGLSKYDTLRVEALGDTSWAESGIDTTPTHIFNLEVVGKADITRPKITVNNRISLGGNTYFDKLEFTGFGERACVYFNDYNVTVGSETVFNPYEISLGSYDTANTVNGQRVVFKNELKLGGQIRLCNLESGDKLYAKDLNVTVDNPNAYVKLVLNQNINSTVTYDKNLNIIIKAAKEVSFGRVYKEGNNPLVAANKSINLVVDNPSATVITDSVEKTIKAISPLGNYYIINNSTGLKDFIEISDASGSFITKANESQSVKVTAKDGKYSYAKDGVIALSSSGIYYVAVEKRNPISKVYYVKSNAKNGNGTKSAPFANVAQAVEYANKAGLIKADSVTVKLLNNASLGSLPKYPFALTVEAVDADTYLSVESNNIANGKTVYKKLILDANRINFGASEVKLEKSVKFTGFSMDVSGARAVIENTLNYVEISGNRNIDLTVNIPNSYIVFNFSASYTDVKINIKAASKLEFNGTPTVSKSMQIAVNKSTSVLGKRYIDDAAALGGKWYIVNHIGKADAIGFTETAGSFTYLNGYEVALKNENSTVYPSNARLVALEGEYKLVNTGKKTTAYSGYIKNRGNGLKNTYTSLQSGKALNVLYLGGSATVGDENSWRERIGKWIVNTFPSANVKNLDVSYDGKGSYFGLYRLNKEMAAFKPDLVFIELSCDDLIEGVSNKNAALQFETIIRQIMAKNPYCDIVNIISAEKNSASSLIYNDKLHTQADAFENISSAYGIPTVRIGHALVDKLYSQAKQANVAWINYWNEYFTDSVHLSQKGHEVFYEAIKEYLANELIYSGYVKATTERVVPSLVNTTLLDGDIAFIDADSTALSTSQAMGGSGFVYDGELEEYHRDFKGGVVSQNGNDSKYVVKFTGTELSVLCSTDKLSGFSLKVDGRAITCNAVNTPTVLVSNLSYGVHTVEISPILTDSNAEALIYGFFTRNQTKALSKNNIVDTLIKEGNKWFYYYYSGIKSNATKLVKYSGKHYYVKNGILDSSYEGLFKYNGKMLYIKNGVWQKGVTKLVNLSGKYNYIKDGAFKKATGIIKVSGKYYYIKSGIRSSKTGLVKYKGKSYYIKNGKWSSKTNTLYKKSGKYYAVKSGKWYKKKAIIKYSGKKYYVNKGYAQMKYSGRVKIGTKSYNVKKGKIV